MSEQPPPPSLADLIDLDFEPRRVWQRHELGLILRTQLATPLSPELRDEQAASDAPITFGALLHDPRPSVELLERVKEFAKTSRHDPRSPLPVEVATLLYCASIAAALLRCDRRISGMSETDLLRNLDWAMAQPWLDDPTRRLIAEARAKLVPAAP